MNLIRAIRKDQALLDDINEEAKFPDEFACWWLGQSGYLLQYKNQKLLIDPYLSDSLTRKYAHTEKPHIRMSERVIDPSLLTGITAVTSSHNHTDHLDPETLQPVMAANPDIVLICPEANRKLVAERAGTNIDFPLGLNEKQSAVVGEFTFHGIAAAHNSLDRDEQGNCLYMGFVVQFGEWTIYHSGDCLLYDGLIETISPFQPDIVFLPINGNDPSRGVAGNMNIDESIHLAKSVNARWLVPCHYDMFTFNTANAEDFAKASIKARQPYCILDPGGKICGKEL
ncbi:MBL fold metallo-hydrolase [Pollutibacter soli]|uniref:MBL fold metallo-hydrolase n=1 Tax=Pollutibacter soli TaxID=3034157 RepID=UPI0030134192